MNTKIITTLFLLLFTFTAKAQTEEWKYINKGNKAFENKDYKKAERNYLSVLKKNSNSPEALFNLGNTQLGLNNPQTALEYYEKVKQLSNDTILNAMTNHNQGWVHQALAMSSTKEEERQQNLRIAIEYYKQSLRLNPADNNTRYNLALCQKLLKDSMQQSQEKSENKEQQSDNQDDQSQQQKTQDTEKDKDDKKKQKYGVVLYDYKTFLHVRGIKPNKQYKLNKKDIICKIGGMER